MKTMFKISKVLYIPLALIAVGSIVSFATDPGSMEAINSASEERRNIIGIEMSTATAPQMAAAGCKEKGVFVSAVIPKHPADVAGLKPNDIIININGNPVEDLSEALMAMNGLDAGRTYPFIICRMDANGIPQKLVLNVLIEKVQEKAIGKIS